ncbi:MAG: HAMP domain-containing histidine kinase [Campylobacteraceae bacterium]|nr:HAMP domain-containing histidine kinase [Campylobacteraceae bacterium]
MQPLDLITLTLLLTLSIIITKHYFQYKLRQKSQHISTLEQELLCKDALLLQNIKLASLGELLENITHQWRQPLATINAVSSNMSFKCQLGNLDDREVSRCVDIIERNVMNLSDTIENFTSLFHDSSHKSYFEIEESFTYITNILQPQFYEAKIELSISLHKATIHTYQSELMQVFMHLLNNSIEILSCHKSKQNYIFIKVRSSKKCTVIQIYDNAKGIPKEYLPEIFEAYFTNKDDGSGAGLYMCKKIVEEKLRGKIRVDNHSYTYKDVEYTGARFCIEIPKVLLDS